MFCYQCEQTAKQKGCTAFGACGKDPETAALQDLVMVAVKDIACAAHKAGQLGAVDPELDQFVINALFTTVTNVNFDPDRLAGIIKQAARSFDRSVSLYRDACRQRNVNPEPLHTTTVWNTTTDIDELIRLGEENGIEQRTAVLGEDIVGIQELALYGLKGTAAYAHHAAALGHTDPEANAFFHRALSALADPEPDAGDLVNLCLECGAVNLKVMELLDRAHREHYGDPEPGTVHVEPRAGKAIVVSGHDLLDLEELLKQTEGRGINVYTHGEMLPAHGYPKLRRYKHLAGNFGGAWQDQRAEFDHFPGAILMTTNCLQKPKHSYESRLFTSGLVAWPGIEHISDRNFEPVIQAALNAPGFDQNGSVKTITVGFGHTAVLGVADKVVDAVKSGAIRHFFLIGGCDGAKSGRNYYPEFAEAVPQDCMILTLACGKYRFNKLDFGDIGGIPRLLDVGQCNDAYSAIKIASALAEAFDTTVNDLPLSFILSWYEQKAVCILLTLLHLGIKGMRLGPSLPAFATPPVAKILTEQFEMQPIDTSADASSDVQQILQQG